MEAAASGLFFFALPGADGAPDGSANASAGGGVLPDDDDEPNHVGERGECGHRRRAQDDALAYAQSGA